MVCFKELNIYAALQGLDSCQAINIVESDQRANWGCDNLNFACVCCCCRKIKSSCAQTTVKCYRSPFEEIVALDASRKASVADRVIVT